MGLFSDLIRGFTEPFTARPKPRPQAPRPDQAPGASLRQAAAPQQQFSHFNQRYAGAPLDNAAQVAEVERQRAEEAAAAQRAEEERQRKAAAVAQETMRRAQELVASAQDKNLYSADMQAIQMEANKGGQANLERLAEAQQKLEKKRADEETKRRVEPLVKEGLSFEDLAAKSGVSTQDVAEYINKNHKGYGNKGLIENVARETGKFLGNMGEAAAGIVTKPVNAVLDQENQQKNLAFINQQLQAGRITPARAKELADKEAARGVGKKAVFNDKTGQFEYAQMNPLEFGGEFTQQGLNTYSVLPIAGGAASGASRFASGAGKEVLQKAAEFLTAGTATQAESKLAAWLAQKGINANAAEIIGNATTSNAKQTAVTGTAQTAADIASGRGVSPESLALNYGADFAMGAVPEIGLGTLGNSVKAGKEAAIQQLVDKGMSPAQAAKLASEGGYAKVPNMSEENGLTPRQTADGKTVYEENVVTVDPKGRDVYETNYYDANGKKITQEQFDKLVVGAKPTKSTPVVDESNKTAPEAVAPKEAPVVQPETPQTDAPVTDPLAALKQEALKYKSADEFVNNSLSKDTPFQPQTEIGQINRILQNKDTVGDGQKIADYYRTVKGENWHVIRMSPDEYLRRANKAIGGNVAEADLGKYKSGDVVKYAADMKKGDKFPMPWVNEVAGSQEGRTRALAAKELGYKEIPVAVATKDASTVQNKQLTDLYNQAHTEAPKTATEKVAPAAAPAITGTPAPLPKIRAYGKEIELSPENGYKATPTADGGAVYSKQTRVGTIKKGDTTYETRWYDSQGNKLTGAQAKAMVDGKLPNLPIKKELAVEVPAGKELPQEQLLQNPDYLSAKSKVEAGQPLNDAEQKAYDAVMGTPEPQGAVKRATAPKPTPEETLYNPTTGEKASSRTAERLLADPTVPKEAKGSLKKLTHDVHNDKLMINASKELVAKSPETARTLFDSGDLLANELGDSHIHLGNALVDHYNAAGLTNEADQVYKAMSESTTPGGRLVRAARSISKVSPQGIVKFAENIADKKGEPLTDAMKKELKKAAIRIAKMPDGPEKESAVKDMLDLARQKGVWDKTKGAISAILSVPKALKTTLDFSFGLRQGLVLGAAHPITFAKVQAKSIRYAFDPKYFAKEMASIVNMTDEHGAAMYPLFRKMGVVLEAVSGGGEEQFGNTAIIESKLAKKLIVGKLVAGSDRAYSGAASMLRAQVLTDIVNNLGGVAEVTKMTTRELQDLGRVINTATGRGQGGKAFEAAVPTLNQGLFAPRFWKSRVDMLNPLYYAPLKGPARKEALKATAAYATLVGLTLIAAKKAGLEVETDPTSSDFAKIKVGNTRYDILGGFQQNIVFAAREITGHTKSTTDGEYHDKNRLEAAAALVRSKASPVAGTIVNIMDGKDMVGNKTTPASVVASLLLPLSIGDTTETVQDTKDPVMGLIKAAPGIFGVGMSTFNSDKPGEALSKEELDKLTPQKFDEYVKRSRSDFGKTLADKSERDRYKILGASKDYQLKMINDGKVTRDQLDALKAKQNRYLYDRGLPIDTGFEPDEFKKFTKEEQVFITNRALNGGIKKDKELEVSQASKDMLTKAFEKDNWPTVDVSGVTMTNALATKWIDYQKTLHEADTDEAKQFDARKDFWTAAVKQKYDKKAVEAYNLGGSTDPKNTYGFSLGTIEQLVSPEGLTVGDKTYRIGKTDFDNMIALDDELLAAGLKATPKFSNKVRRAYGYGDAPDSAITGVGNGQSSKGSGGGRGGRGRAPARVSTHPGQLLTDFGGKAAGGVKQAPAPKALPNPNLARYRNKGGKKGTIRIKL